MSLARNIRKYRERAGMDQVQLAKQLDRTNSAVSQWESGRTVPRMPMIHKMADLFGVTVAELMGEDAAEPVPFRASGTMVPLLGWTHMGGPVDEDGCERMVGVPADVVDAHPGCYLLHAQGECMDNRFPTDCVILVDPDMQPRNGDAVLAEIGGYQTVVREFMRGTSTVMLTADSHSGHFDDIVAGPEDEPVVLKGVIVWYQSEQDLRR